ncbi:uncharacterized protein LOC131681231 [Topomyia yanbarensis]|uniref:uncharacterized protein LOC131681231 n=1 Tax=Topomyia yanbarensis TaxID=2498891 RepID=UPI00273C3183|nr:uncharacterized protein LOC131681231 [Topomyia yanbarensis]
MSWPSQVADPEAAEAEEERKRAVIGAVVSCSTEFNNWYFARYSNYTVLIRTTAYCQRFIRNFRIKYQTGLSLRPTIGALTTEELRKAEQTIVHRVQKEAFAKEYEALLKGKPVSRLSPLRWFHPRLSSNEVIRIGGRLGKSYETEEAKHPMVLPARHHITRLLLRHYHEKMLHAGVQLLLSAIRQRFWPLGGRSVAKQIVHKCMRCYRTKPTTIRQFMAELPTPRVTAGRPFTTTGVDYFGPIYIRPGYRRAAVKAYVSVFVCFATKAVHLELAGDLTTSCFIQALRRFVSRRGRCATIFSDNGTNFVGARNQLAELISKLKNKQHHEEIAKECAKDNINWHFNPPGAPHFGGLWEAAVRSAKYHLLRVMGDTAASYEDTLTVLTQVESCLNSRPLTQLTDDPNDMEPLTPGHFLVGGALQALPDADFGKTPINRLTHWQAVQRKVQDFWKRWRLEYLSQLQGRSKRWLPPVAIEPGKLVVVYEDNSPPIHWRMGRIQEIHPGTDGVVRVVTLKTSKGVIQRPVEKICLLPIANDSENRAEDGSSLA